MTFKKILFLSTATILIFIGIYLLGINTNQIPTIEPINNFATHYLEELANEEQLLWDELNCMGINTADLEKFRIEHNLEYIECRKELPQYISTVPLSEKTVEMINDIARDFNIDINNIPLVHIKGRGYAGSATDYQIKIDESALLKFSPDAQRFIIAHELQHLRFKDDSTRLFIYNNISDDMQQLNNPYHIMNKISRFQEKRADMLAILKNQQYAQGAIEYGKKLFQQAGIDDLGNTHPKISERLNLAQSIFEQHTLTLV